MYREDVQVATHIERTRKVSWRQDTIALRENEAQHTRVLEGFQ